MPLWHHIHATGCDFPAVVCLRSSKFAFLWPLQTGSCLTSPTSNGTRAQTRSEIGHRIANCSLSRGDDPSVGSPQTLTAADRFTTVQGRKALAKTAS